MKTKITIAALFLFMSFAAVPTRAVDQGYSNIVNHLKSKYRAKKVNIPMMWLARFAVKMVRPAGVKSFSLTLFENLNFSPEKLDGEMQSAMHSAMGKDWHSVFRVRSRSGQQAYMYMREDGADIKILLVTIDQNHQAAVIRAKFSPEKLAEFIENPQILGISVNDDKEIAKDQTIEK